jgi:hypothetical protein
VTVRRISSGTLVDTPLVTTAETVVATVTGVSTGQAGQFVDLTGDFNVTLGTNTTAVTVRVRRDSLRQSLLPRGPRSDTMCSSRTRTLASSSGVRTS